MPKRYTDTDIWKKQRWFKRLPPNYKLAFFYIKDQCDQAGIWKIDCVELSEDLGLEEFNLNDFISHCNKDTDKITGKEKKKERVKLISQEELWITGFIQFQYENKNTGLVLEAHTIGGPAIQKLKDKKLFNDAVRHNFIRLK